MHPTPKVDGQNPMTDDRKTGLKNRKNTVRSTVKIGPTNRKNGPRNRKVRDWLAAPGYHAACAGSRSSRGRLWLQSAWFSRPRHRHPFGRIGRTGDHRHRRLVAGAARRSGFHQLAVAPDRPDSPAAE